MSVELSSGPTCPVCGAPVHMNSQSCGSCGARYGPRGWKHSEEGNDLDSPEDDDDFDYQEFIAREFGEEEPAGFLRRMSPKQRFWWLVALVTLIAFAWLSIVAIR